MVAATSHLPSDLEIVISREFAAPRDLVWKAWTNPDQLAKWWGPNGFTTTTSLWDCVPGGGWRYVMHGPDGRDYQNWITYLEVVEPERLAYKHGGASDCEPVNFQVVVTFEEPLPGKTLITMRSLFPSKASRDFVINNYNAVEGGKQTLGRLADLLESQPTASSANLPFTITRVVRAPKDLVWKAWTDRDQLQQWFGPKGVPITTCSLDFRIGGRFHFCLQVPGGDMWAQWIFREIAAPDRLQFVSTFSDEKGDVTRAPFEGEWPLETLTTVTFAEHAGMGKGTVVTVTSQPIGASAMELQTFDQGRESMTGGWSGTFEQLAEYLARAFPGN